MKKETKLWIMRKKRSLKSLEDVLRETAVTAAMRIGAIETATDACIVPDHMEVIINLLTETDVFTINMNK